MTGRSAGIEKTLSPPWPSLYCGSVKNLLGPVRIPGQSPEDSALVFEYTDSYSVFDWGRMPDDLEGKGRALAVMAACWFERIEKPETWREFLESDEGRKIKAANRFGREFETLGESLAQEGLRTHYLGVLSDDRIEQEPEPTAVGTVGSPPRFFLAREVNVVRPELAQILGRAVPDYFSTRASRPPRLVPLEVVFRFGVPEGSSLLARLEQEPRYLSEIGFGEWKVSPGVRWEFPVLELFTKLESSDRILTLTEALGLAGISGVQLQELLFKTAWVAGLLHFWCRRAGLELADGKLEWALDEKGRIFLVDAIGPDELRLLKDGVQLSKEFLRGFYRATPWYASLSEAKARAHSEGVADWKRFVPAGPPPLAGGHRALASQMYQALANELTGRCWFGGAPSLQEVACGIRALESMQEHGQGEPAK